MDNKLQIIGLFISLQQDKLIAHPVCLSCQHDTAEKNSIIVIALAVVEVVAVFNPSFKYIVFENKNTQRHVQFKSRLVNRHA